MALYKGTQKICPIVRNKGLKYGLSIDSVFGDVDANGILQEPNTDSYLVFTGVEDIAYRGLFHKFYRNPTIKSVDLSSLTTVSGEGAMDNAFYGCTGITSVDLSNLTTASGSSAIKDAFTSCTGITSVDLTSLTTVSGNSAMNGTFNNCSGITGALDLSSLTTISGVSAMNEVFRSCTHITSVDLSSLTTVSGGSVMDGAFTSCTGITSVDLSSLTTVSGMGAMDSAFSSCTNLASINLNGLQTIEKDYGQFAYCFSGCTALTSLTFPNLEKIYCTGGTAGYYGTFAYNNKVQKMYFPKLDTITYSSGASSSNQNACKNIFYNCSALTELHFGSANQSAIEATAGYSTAWGRGAGNVTIYFDL